MSKPKKGAGATSRPVKTIIRRSAVVLKQSQQLPKRSRQKGTVGVLLLAGNESGQDIDLAVEMYKAQVGDPWVLPLRKDQWHPEDRPASRSRKSGPGVGLILDCQFEITRDGRLRLVRACPAGRRKKIVILPPASKIRGPRPKGPRKASPCSVNARMERKNWCKKSNILRPWRG